MARSYTRLKRRNKAGLLVRENPVQLAVSANSLYCVPVRATLGPATSADVDALQKSDFHKLKFPGTGSTPLQLASVVRVSSMLVSSKSPFIIKVLNSAGSYTTYQCPGQKVTKITFSRESSIIGNAALFNDNYNQQVNNLVKISAAEDSVDIRYNCVVDSTLDD